EKSGGAPSFAVKLNGLAVVPLEQSKGVSVIGLRDAAPPLLWRPGPGRHAFAGWMFAGRESDADQLRSNASGIGVQAGVQVGSRRTSLVGIRPSSGPGQSLAPMVAGLGGRAAIDYVTLLWPDGVLQTETAVAPGEHKVVETQRQLSSCPVLFCYDGERFVFVTDLLGVGGLGFAVGRNEYAPAVPRESVLLPAGLPRAADGRLTLKLTEPMEEACYLDHVELVAYDLPPGWNMTVDERMNIAGEPATGEAVFYQRKLAPTAAVNDRQENVATMVAQADGRAADVGRRDSRFLGRTEPHSLTLTFDEALDELPRPTLLASGWIEYPYSQTMFAAWQAGAAYEAPSVEARGGDGRWTTVLSQFGYPAGMPREMSVALGDLPPGCRQLRITTNQEIYWDALAVVAAEDCPTARVASLPLDRATVGECGFPEWTFGPQRTPQFNYDRRAPLWDTRHQSGYYTRIGRAEPLLEERDAAVAIFWTGRRDRLAVP
ncbi:MAG: hypothetical protein KDA41_19130, partial [Planctomycetales bacterium]|nr:hypothetical protein [Planctomycetales bacterium]